MSLSHDYPNKSLHDKGHYNSMFAVHVLTFMVSVNFPITILDVYCLLS